MLLLLDKIITVIYFFELSCTNATNWLSDSYTRHNTLIPKTDPQWNGVASAGHMRVTSHGSQTMGTESPLISLKKKLKKKRRHHPRPSPHQQPL